MSKLHDTQNSFDNRNIDITRVGIKDFHTPVQLRSISLEIQPSIASISMYGFLSRQYRGTHMSRFISLIHEHTDIPVDSHMMRKLVWAILERLNTHSAEVILKAPFFIKKQAPVTKQLGLMDYHICYRTIADQGNITQILQVKVPVTSLCPCSKQISDYGAHNQRSILTIEAEYEKDFAPEILIHAAEESASCGLYSVLKREDEKYVTEFAYNHAKFAEDIVRDAYSKLRQISDIKHFRVSTENIESIHNHAAYAEIIF
jgi:GTP cyclohydrolase folE2